MSSLSQSRTLGQTQTWFCLVKFKRQIRIRFRSILLSAQKTTQKTAKEKNTQKVQKRTQGLIWQLKKGCVALLSNYLRAQKSGFTLLSAFLNGLLFLVLFWALKKNTQGTSEPLWQIHVTTLTIQCYNCDSLCVNSNVGWFCNKQSQSNSLAILYQQYSNNMATTWQQHATALQPHSNSTATVYNKGDLPMKYWAATCMRKEGLQESLYDRITSVKSQKQEKLTDLQGKAMIGHGPEKIFSESIVEM